MSCSLILAWRCICFSLINISAHESAARTWSAQSAVGIQPQSLLMCLDMIVGIKTSRNYSTRPRLANLQLERDQRKCIARRRRPALVAPHVSWHDCRGKNITRLIIIHSRTEVMFTQDDVAQLNNSKMISICSRDTTNSSPASRLCSSKSLLPYAWPGIHVCFWWCYHVSFGADNERCKLMTWSQDRMFTFFGTFVHRPLMLHEFSGNLELQYFLWSFEWSVYLPI